MLTTIQGRYHAQKALVKQDAKEAAGMGLKKNDYWEYWDESDMEVLRMTKFGLDIEQIVRKKKDPRIF